MVNRYTFTQLVMESKETFRHDAIRRRSSGFRYWLLVPFASLVIYAVIAWLSFLGLSALAEKLRMRLRRWRAHAG